MCIATSLSLEMMTYFFDNWAFAVTKPWDIWVGWHMIAYHQCNGSEMLASPNTLRFWYVIPTRSNSIYVKTSQYFVNVCCISFFATCQMDSKCCFQDEWQLYEPKQCLGKSYTSIWLGSLLINQCKQMGSGSCSLICTCRGVSLISPQGAIGEIRFWMRTCYKKFWSGGPISRCSLNEGFEINDFVAAS